MHVATASPLPRVEMVTDRGLKSQSATQMLRSRLGTPSLASNIWNSLENAVQL
jgi:hypothetical protein